jgi:hypothetical protein
MYGIMLSLGAVVTLAALEPLKLASCLKSNDSNPNLGGEPSSGRPNRANLELLSASQPV